MGEGDLFPTYPLPLPLFKLWRSFRDERFIRFTIIRMLHADSLGLRLALQRR